MNKTAEENHAVYALVNGDQPRNLLDLYSWGRALGLEIIAAGKASEYDFVWDYETGELTYTDGTDNMKILPEMKECWRYGGIETLQKRKELLKSYTCLLYTSRCV